MPLNNLLSDSLTLVLMQEVSRMKTKRFFLDDFVPFSFVLSTGLSPTSKSRR